MISPNQQRISNDSTNDKLQSQSNSSSDNGIQCQDQSQLKNHEAKCPESNVVTAVIAKLQCHLQWQSSQQTPVKKDTTMAGWLNSHYVLIHGFFVDFFAAFWWGYVASLPLTLPPNTPPFPPHSKHPGPWCFDGWMDRSREPRKQKTRVPGPFPWNTWLVNRDPYVMVYEIIPK